MLTSVLGFLAGILVIQQLTHLPEPYWLVAGIVSAVISAWFRQWLVLFFLMGLLWATVFAIDRLHERLPELLAGKDFQIEGFIADLPEVESNHVRVNLTLSQAHEAIPDNLRLTWYYPEKTLKAGQKWRFTVRLKPPHGNLNPGGFDYERWLFTEGIGATGYIRSKPEPILLSEGSALTSLSVWRQHIADKLDSTLDASKNLAMIKALTIGDGNSLTPEQWDVFRKTGTTHLMVISGSHIGLIAGLVYWLIVRWWAWVGVLRWSPQKIAALVALFVGVVYAGLTGFSVPAQRSALMISIAMLAIIQQRNTHPLSVLAVALMAVLIIDPLVVLSPGFWLSFIAVCLIIYTLAGRQAKLGFWQSSLQINWITSVGLSPLLLFFFQQISLIAPIANLIAVPVISLLIVPLALLATLVMMFSPAFAKLLFMPVDYSLQMLWWLLAKLAALPLAAISHEQPSWCALVLVVPAVLLLFAPKGINYRWLGLIMLFPLVFTSQDKLDSGTIKLTLLDVGQGLSAVVQTSQHTLIYDTGSKFSATSDSGQSVVLPYLRSQGIDKVDNLIISHGDNDHIGGAQSLLQNIPVTHILTSVPQLLPNYAPTRCEAGQQWTWDGIIFEILSPKPDVLPSENDNSCVLKIQAQNGSVLLTGDIEAAAESWLVDHYANTLKSELLVAPHHGSHTSSTVNFLLAVNPKLILIPAGYHNPFGHPHPDVLKRYKHFAINWLNTADSGAIQATITEYLTWKTWRTVAGKYWHYHNE